MGEVTKIDSAELYEDFQAFLADPEVKVLEESTNDIGKLYKFNTGEQILVPSSFESNDKKIIFGKDKTENIVNITIEPTHATIYLEKGGIITTQKRPYSPWILTKDSFSASSQKLKGDQYYKHLTTLPLSKYREIEESWNKNIWNPRGIQEGYMLWKGATYFKGMKVEDLSLLSFDIETTTLDPNHPDAEVILISNTYRKNGKLGRKLFKIKDYNNDLEMIEAWSEWVIQIDPSVMLGHNVFGFDLNYLNERADSSLFIGRDGSPAKFTSKPHKFRKDGSQQYDYYNCTVAGREIIDTFFLSIKYDIGRKFPSYGLKAIEKHLNLVDDTRTQWDFEKNNPKNYKNWSEETWAEFCKYCNDDGDSPIKMFDLMIPPFFYLAQSVPKTFQQIINEASGSALDSIMVRSYLQDGYSQPNTSGKVPFEGAISMGNPGLYDNVRKVDVASLYPSIMLNYNIYDTKKDPNGHQIKILKYFTEERLKNKSLGKSSLYHKQLSDSQKIVINSYYGFMGAGRLLYNYPEGAARVTRHGREILQMGVEWATGHRLKHVVKKIKNKGKENEEIEYEWIIGPKISEGLGYTLVNVDTDSFSVTNGQAPTKEGFQTEIDALNSLYPDLIKWEDDDVFQKALIVKAKNYVLKKHPNWCSKDDYDKDGNIKLKYKGSSLTDQKKEPVLINLLKEMIEALIQDSDNRLEIYNNYVKKIFNIEDMLLWATKKTVTKSVLNPKRTNEQKVLDALSGENIQEGDKVWLYTAIDPEDSKKTILKLAKNWDGDEATEHYLKRVWSTVKILETVLDINEFPKYHLKKNKELLDNLING